MDLCLFQGTFNPIHNAHLRVAEYILNNSEIETITFIPAYLPPHKESDISLAEHRYEMLKIALAYNPNFRISDIEYKRKGVSYTYLTICELKKLYKINKKIKFIIGTDAFRQIESWYETDKLKELVEFIVFLRDTEFKEIELEYLRKKGYSFRIMPLDFEDISSSDIRNKISNNQPISGLVPQEVEEYIIKNELYKI